MTFTTFSQSNLSATDLILTYVNTNARSRSSTALEIRACCVFSTITFSCCGPAQVDPWRTYISVTRDLTRPQSVILIPIAPRAPFGRTSLLRSKERGLGTSQTRNSDRPLRKYHNFLNGNLRVFWYSSKWPNETFDYHKWSLRNFSEDQEKKIPWITREPLIFFREMGNIDFIPIPGDIYRWLLNRGQFYRNQGGWFSGLGKRVTWVTA